MLQVSHSVESTIRGITPCLACMQGLHAPMSLGTEAPGQAGDGFFGQAVDDPEGARIPAGLPPVMDAHVHVFPDPIFDALWAWFDRHGWPIRYKFRTPDVVRFLLEKGIRHLVVCAFAHKEGMARRLNRYLADLVQAQSGLTALGSVYPGEDGAVELIEEAFSLGLGGLKLHCHVQAVSPDEPRMHEIYDACIRWGRPLLIHAGKAPRSPAYPRDPDELCSVDRVESVLRSFPRLKLCIPHLGADEFKDYADLLERYDNLWLDTTMALANYFPGDCPWFLAEMRPERVMYGTDFPNLPYAWDRELRRIVARSFREEDLAMILGGTAADFYAVTGFHV